MRIQRPCACGDSVAPHFLEQLSFREDSFRRAREPQQQLVLLLRELHAVSRDAHDASRHVDVNRRRVDDLLESRSHPAENGANPLDELLILERRNDVVVAPLPEGVDAIDGVGLLPAEHDHRRAFDPTIHVGNVAGEHEVESSMRADQLEPVPREVTLEKAPGRGLRVGEQEAGGR